MNTFSIIGASFFIGFVIGCGSVYFLTKGNYKVDHMLNHIPSEDIWDFLPHESNNAVAIVSRSAIDDEEDYLSALVLSQ